MAAVTAVEIKADLIVPAKGEAAVEEVLRLLEVSAVPTVDVLAPVVLELAEIAATMVVTDTVAVEAVAVKANALEVATVVVVLSSAMAMTTQVVAGVEAVPVADLVCRPVPKKIAEAEVL